MRILVLLITLLATHVACAAEAANLVAPWREGQHYATLPVPVAADGEKVVVTEFFSYACIHCFQFDPDIET